MDRGQEGNLSECVSVVASCLLLTEISLVGTNERHSKTAALLQQQN